MPFSTSGINTAYLLLGSNLGDKAAHLQRATELIHTLIGKVIRKSAIYQTAPWGLVHEETFLNQCLFVETHLEPAQLLQQILDIENEMGRYRKKKWEARLIDVDILLFNNIVVEEENLRIPHPYLPERRFALTPLNEIAPHIIHPTLNTSIQELLDACPDQLFVKRML